MTHDELRKAAWVCVLNDSNDYTGLDGCWIALTTPGQVESLDDGELDVSALRPQFGLQSLLEFAIDAGYFDNADGLIGN